MKKNYTIIIALLLSSVLNAKDKVLSVSPPPNTPPTIVAATGQSTELHYCPGSPLANIEIVVGDWETPYKNLIVTFSSSNQAYIANSEIKGYPDPATFVTNGQRYLGITGNTIIPSGFVNGYTDITVRVTDGGGLSASQVFRIYIENSSQPTIVKTGYIASGYIDIPLSSSYCSYTLEDFTGNVTVSDDCTDTPNIVVTQQATLNGTTYNIGDTIPGQQGDIVEVKLTATDLVGKTSDTSFTIILKDTTTPLIYIVSPLVNEVLDAGASDCKFTIKDYTSNVFFSDDCSPMVTITQTPAAGTIVDFSSTNPEQIITFTCIDYAGNSAMDSFTVKVIDLTNPVAKAKDFFVAELDATGIYTFTGDELNDGSTDNCQIVNYTCYPAFVDCSNLGTPVTVTMAVTDLSGNTATSTTTVTVRDTTTPIISTSPVVVNTNSGCTWNGTLGLPVTADNCLVVSVTSDKAADFAYPVGDTTVTWTVTDAAGNIAAATQTVTVNDVEKPIAKASDITIKLSSTVGAGAATITVADVNNGSSDNCGIKSVTINKSTFNCSNVGPNTVVITVTDNSDNISTANAIVTVVDDTLPVINSVSPITVNNSTGICGANLAVAPSAKATDNCSVNPVVGTRSDAKALNAVYPIGRTSITWNVKDANGNAALPVIQTVDVTDNEKPLITSNGNKNVNADLGGCSAIVTVSATATDNCTVGSPVGVRNDGKALTEVYPIGTTTISWTVTDVNGNAALAVTQTVKVTDIQKPVITANGNKEVNSYAGQCGALVTVSATATDNCAVGSPTGVRSDNLPLAALYPIGTTTIAWNVTDANGNAAVAVPQTVTVKDEILPIARTRNITVQLNAAGTVSILPSDINNGSTDNCSITSYSLSKDTFTCADVGSNVISLIVTDASGNASMSFATVIVEDKVAPIMVTKNIQLVLDNGSVTIKPEDVLVSATDACGVNIASYSLSKDTFTIADVLAGPVTITVYATDIYGNLGSAPATVTFPTPIVASQVLTPNGDGINDTWIVENITNNPNSVVRVFNRWGSLVYSAKNYQNDWDGKLNGSDVSAPVRGYYYYKIDLKDTGNVDSEGWLYISCSDVITPTVITKNITVQLNVSGTVSIVPADVLVSATDACGIDVYSYALSKSTFTNVDALAGPVTITVYATDINGNVGSANAKVTFTTLSVDTYKKEKEITIYPNPTTSVLHLQCSNEVIIDKVVVRDLNGKIVVQQAEITSEINVEKLAAGIYTLEADSGKNKFKTKFIKE